MVTLNNKTRLKPCHNFKCNVVGTLLTALKVNFKIPSSANIGKKPNNKVSELKIATGIHKNGLVFGIFSCFLGSFPINGFIPARKPEQAKKMFVNKAIAVNQIAHLGMCNVAS